MKQPEQNLWVRCGNALAVPAYKGLRLERIEATAVNPGIPDVLACYEANVTWLELKQVAEWPARAGSQVMGDKGGLNQAEKNWHLSWRNAGGYVATLIGVGSYEYFLVDGAHSDFVNHWTKAELFKHSTARGNRERFFPTLFEYLKG